MHDHDHEMSEERLYEGKEGASPYGKKAEIATAKKPVKASGKVKPSEAVESSSSLRTSK